MDNYEFKDRGMLKWGGFLLAEHSARNEHECETRNQFYPPLPLMDEDTINTVIQEAVLNNKSVSIQTKDINIDGLHAANITGKILGGENGELLIGDKRILYEDIRHISCVKIQKWNDFEEF